MPRNNRHTSLPPPYLKRVWIDDEAVPDRDAYPFCLPMSREPARDANASVSDGKVA